MQHASLSPPVCVVIRDLMRGGEAPYMVRPGQSLRELEPERDRFIAAVNGKWQLRAEWDEPLQPGDVVTWLDASRLPQDRDTLRIVLQVSIIVVATILQQYQLYGWAAAVAIVGNLAVNYLLPPKIPEPLGAPGSVYSASLAGNVARLDQPIWKVCGRVKLTPPFAAMPWAEYVPNPDDSDPNDDRDQVYNAVFAIGVGNHVIEKAFIGKTSIAHFDDVAAAYRAPGEAVTVACNVVTSTEVGNQKIAGRKEDADLAYYVGPFTATRPGDLAVKVSLDIMAEQGLGGASGESRTVVWRAEARAVNDYGAPIGNWFLLGIETRTNATNTPQRWTTTYDLPGPIRPEVRVLRTDLESKEPQFRDGITWIGLRAFLQKPAPLNAETAHYQVTMRASEQLTNQSQTDFSMIVRAMCRTLNEDLEWQAEVFTRNPAWWLLDLLTSDTWGLALPEDRVDLQSFYDLAQICDARQDRFDYVFTDAMDAWEALQLIAHACRARVFRRGMVYTVTRDEKIDLPVAALTHRNTMPGTMVLSSSLPTYERPDGYVVQYQSNVTWDLAEIECPCPGYTVRNTDDPRYNPALPMMSKPVWMRLDGVTGYYQALREGLYQAASLAYRREVVSCDLEMEGMLLAFMDPVRWQPRMVGYGQSGDVAFWDAETLVMGLTEPPDWSQAPLYLVLRRDDNTLTEPVEVTPGPTAYDVILPEVPDFEVVLDDGTRERPIFLLGPLNTSDEWCKITRIEDGGQTDDGAQLYKVSAMVDSDAVHMADKEYLPGPGDDQDPIDSGFDYPDDDTGGGVGLIVRLTEHAIAGGNEGIPDLDNRGGYAEFRMFNDGRAGWRSQNGTEVILETASGYYPAEWLVGAPVEPTTAAAYEVHFEPYGGLPAVEERESWGVVFSGSPFLTWLTLDAERSVRMFADAAVSDERFGAGEIQFAMTVRIREAAYPTIILAERRVMLIVKFDDTDTGNIDGGGY